MYRMNNMIQDTPDYTECILMKKSLLDDVDKIYFVSACLLHYVYYNGLSRIEDFLTEKLKTYGYDEEYYEDMKLINITDCESCFEVMMYYLLDVLYNDFSTLSSKISVGMIFDMQDNYFKYYLK